MYSARMAPAAAAFVQLPGFTAIDPSRQGRALSHGMGWAQAVARWPALGALRWPWQRARADRQWPAVTAVMVGDTCHVARVELIANGSATPRVSLVHADEGGPELLRQWRQRGWFARSQTLLVLPPEDRHFLTFDQPEVPPQDLALAVRFPLCEALDCEPETLLTTAVTMPRINDASRPQVLAVAAHLQPVREQLAVLAKAGIQARAVDVCDSALRGMALLAGKYAEGCVVLSFVGNDICIGLLWQGQFCALRSMTLPPRAPDDDTAFEEQLALHIQRTADHFERQATQLAVRQVLASMPALSDEARQTVLSALPLRAEVFRTGKLMSSSPQAREACSGHNDLTALACVAAARLLDNHTEAESPSFSDDAQASTSPRSTLELDAARTAGASAPAPSRRPTADALP